MLGFPEKVLHYFAHIQVFLFLYQKQLVSNLENEKRVGTVSFQMIYKKMA
jgi:hypothetical protein